MDNLTDETTENVVLGGLILNPSEYSEVAQYISDVKVFSQKKARALWYKITKMIKNRSNIDTLTVCNSISSDEQLQGLSKGYVIECTTDACSLGMTQSYAQSIYEKYLLRKIIEETAGIKDNVINHGSDVYDMISSTHSLMGELIRVRPGERFDISETMNDTITTMKEGNKRMIKTGYKEIDNLAGGLTRGEITIVGGRPGHGKTTFLVNLLASLINGGYKVAMFNRELPNTEVIKKLICIEMPKLLYREVRRGMHKSNDGKFVERLKQAHNIITTKYSEDKFIMFDNIRNFTQTASEVKKFKPDVIIDDYIQLVKPSSKEDSRRLELESICNDYKWLAKEIQCSVILASQLNRYLESRGREHKRPQLSDLAESGAIEQVAENVLFLFYKYKIDPTASKKEIQLIASKVRYGESNAVDLSYAGDCCTIYDNWTFPIKEVGRKNKEEEETLEIPL